MGGPLPPPKPPWWQRDGVVSRLLAGAGVGVTLIGVVMLLVLAVRAGVFGPWMRVSGGALLSAGLVAAGWRVFDRAGGRVGGIALAGTGIAGFFMVVVAMTSIYEWVPPTIGLGMAAVVAAAAVALAMHWRSQILAVLVTAAVAALAPVLTDGLTLTLVGFLVLLQVAGAVPEAMREWPVLCAVRTLPVVIALVLGQAEPTSFDFQLTVTASVIVAVVGLVSGLFSARRPMEELTGIVFLLSFMPVLAMIPQMSRPAAVVLAVVLAAATVIGMVIVRPVGPITAVAGAVVAGLLTLEAAFAVTTGDWLAVILLAMAVVLAAGAHHLRSAVATWAALGFFVIGFGAFIRTAPITALTMPGEAVDHLTFITLIGGLLLTAAACVQAVALNRLSMDGGFLMIAASLFSAYGVTTTIISLGVIANGEDGFLVGQFVVTVAWMSVAMVLLAHGLRTPEHAKVALSAGLSVVAIALTKLFFFDMAALSGMTRAGTFIVVGLLLLLAGSRYAQAMASGNRTSDV